MRRVVITGMGVVAPNGKDLSEFKESLKRGRSGIAYHDHLSQIGMRCQVAGIPEYDDHLLKAHISSSALKHITSITVKYACKAAVEAWLDADLPFNMEEEDIHTGCILGSSISDVDQIKEVINKVDNGEIRKLGTRVVEQVMVSGVGAKVAGLLGLGNRVFTNSSACATGTESVLLAYEYIKSGGSERMVAGSCESPGKYIWSNFDNMRLLAFDHNDKPCQASRPLSASASGFVPGAGAGVLILEELEAAKKRGARIYAEIVGGASNSGGQRQDGSMTAPNKRGVVNCIAQTLRSANINSEDVDLISGHLTATMADPIEVENWSVALGRKALGFPKINSMKSMIGHCLSAAGSIEIVGVALQVYHGFIHASLNSEDVHPAVLNYIDKSCIPHSAEERKINYALKANFGFGDVNSIIAIKKYEPKIN